MNITDTQRARAEQTRQFIDNQVRIELARTRRIESMRAAAEQAHKENLRAINAAAGPHRPALVRRIREEAAKTSRFEIDRRARLQTLALRIAHKYGDTPEKQRRRREEVETP